jgi:lipoprotein-releasing system ATP-binding protein
MSGGFDIRVEGLSKTFWKGGQELRVLRDLDLELRAGERVAIVGQSGSGKSTFLHVVGTLDRPSSGQIWFGDRQVFSRSDAELDALRNQEIGFVFQFHHLMPDQDALHNVMLPALIGGETMSGARKRASDLLDRVGLGARLGHKPGELSGGEQQRVAIARALVRRPSLVLADEPTGNLDPGTAGDIFNMLMELNSEEGTTLVVVTHSLEIASHFPRCLRLVDGQFDMRSSETDGGQP